MHPILRDARTLIDATCADVPRGALAWQRPGKWSGAQVLEHLAKAFGTTAYILDKCVREQRIVGTAPSLIQRCFTFAIVRAGYFPPGRQAPPVTHPVGLEPDAALDAARASLDALDAAAAQALTAFGPRARVANHPLLGGFTVDQWRRFHRAHTRHHMRLLAGALASRPAEDVSGPAARGASDEIGTGSPPR